MKRILLVLLTIIIILGLAGCTGGAGATNMEKTDNQKLTAFEQFEKGLKDNNLTYEKVIMAADMVGAVEGYKYKFESGKAEVYRFDKDSKALKDASENKSLRLEGFGSFPAEINGNFVLLVDDRINNDSIMKIFKEIK